MRQFYNISVTGSGGRAVFGPFSGGAGGQKDGESAAFARLAFDGQPALMAVDDVLDDGQAQAGAALFPAALDVHPVEPLGQAGNGARRDAFAVVAHRGEDLAVRRCAQA